MAHAWMVRAGDDNELIETFTRLGVVSIGWIAMGDMASLTDRESFKQAYARAYPDHSQGKINVNAGQVFRFIREMHPGDLVVTFDKSTRIYSVGEITSEARYDPRAIPEYPNIRSVRWQYAVHRDRLSPATKNTLGSTMTIFTLDSCIEEIRTHVGDTGDGLLPPSAEPEETVPYAEEVGSRAEELIADLMSKLDAYDFQAMVAGILRSMGFRTKESDPGRDLGIDIVATSDPFGFELPRIKVQVKHRTSKASGPDIRNFASAMERDDSGIFISTGGFTSDAKMEAHRIGGKLNLMDRDDFIVLMLEHYEKLEPRFQAMIPLVKVWLPARS